MKIEFVKAGEKNASTYNSVPWSYLDGANDWKLMVDLGGMLKVPIQIADTNQRPDMILMSESTKIAGVIELTVPNEDIKEVSGELIKSQICTPTRTRKGQRLENPGVGS